MADVYINPTTPTIGGLSVSATNPLPVTTSGGSGGGQPVGAATFTPGQVTNITTNTAIVAARTGVSGTGRVSVTFYNQGSVTVYIGPTGVTTSTGIPILAGGSYTLYTTAALFGTVASGTGSIAYGETY